MAANRGGRGWQAPSQPTFTPMVITSADRVEVFTWGANITRVDIECAMGVPPIIDLVEVNGLWMSAEEARAHLAPGLEAMLATERAINE